MAKGKPYDFAHFANPCKFKWVQNWVAVKVGNSHFEMTDTSKRFTELWNTANSGVISDFYYIEIPNRDNP